MFKLIKEIQDLKGKKVLLRTDFDVPIEGDLGFMNNDLRIGETFRIKKQKETLDYLIERGAIVVMISHIAKIPSFEPILSQLEEILGHKINFVKDLAGLESVIRNPQSDNLFLLDNIRQHPEEEKNDEEFAKKLAGGFDIYVNNAFAVSHRKHASVSAITKFLSSYAGLQVEEEVSRLSEALKAPGHGKVIIMGGAKASTKIPVIKNFLDKSEKILLGGVIANDILKAGGMDIKDSVADENSAELFAGIDLTDNRLVIPDDFARLEGKILDIGPNTTKVFKDYIFRAKMVIWNGPLGLFEDERFAVATNSVAEAVTSLTVPTILGGGDTISAVNKLGLLDKFSFVSTGGGAMLEFLAGNRLPGLEVLGYYD